jgi:hypothetical protein
MSTPENRKHVISTDKRMNPALKEEVTTMRGSILDQAEKSPLPDRFTLTNHPDRPAMIITDTQSNRSVTVSLFAYREVREALYTLFNEEGEE